MKIIKLLFLLYGMFNLIPVTVSSLVWITTGEPGQFMEYTIITILCFGLFRVIDLLEEIKQKLQHFIDNR